MNLSRLFKQSSIYLIGDTARRTVGFLMIPLYTRFLSPTEYGVIELIELFITVVTVLFGTLAISDAMVRIYHEYTEGKERSGVVYTAAVGMIVISLLAAAVGILLSRTISEAVFRSPDYADVISIAFVAMVFGNLTELGLVYQRMRQRAVFFVTFSLVQLAALLGMNIYFIVVARMGVRGLLLSKLICMAASAVVLLFIVLRDIEWKFHLDAARRMASFGGPLLISSASLFVIHFGDRFFLSRYANLDEVGVYALAYKFGFLVTYLVGEPFGRVWSVSLYDYVKRSDWKEHFARVAVYLTFCLFLAGLGLSLLIDQTLAVMSSAAFHAGAQLVPALAFAYVAREIGDFFRGVLFIDKRSRTYSVITFGCAICNLALNAWLIPTFHAAGAAAATLATWVIYMLCCWIIASRKHEIPFRARSVVLLATVAVCVLIITKGASQIPFPLQWLTDSLLILLFVATAWGAGYFPVQERARVKEYFAGQKQFVAALSGRFHQA